MVASEVALSSSRSLLSSVRRFALVGLMAVFSAIVHAPKPASAQATPDEQTQQARALFEEGLRFVEGQQWQEAADRFGRVLAIRASATVSYNYASALVHLGHMVEASRALRGVAADPAASREVVEAARTLLAEVEPRIGQLTVRLRGDVSNVSVTIDDKPLPEGSIGIPVPLDPGQHIVRATRGGLPLARRAVDVTDGSPLLNVTIDVVPLPATVAANAPPSAGANPMPLPDTADDDGGSGTIYWMVGGGVLAVGAMVLVGVLLASPSDPDPVVGNTNPSVVHVR
jgi:hypothetical protein